MSARILIALVSLYRGTLGPLLGGACRFHPSCSQYAQEAIARHGARRGTRLALRRLLRCRPFGPFGFDPVPDDPAQPSSFQEVHGNLSTAQGRAAAAEAAR